MQPSNRKSVRITCLSLYQTSSLSSWPSPSPSFNECATQANRFSPSNQIVIFSPLVLFLTREYCSRITSQYGTGYILFSSPGRSGAVVEDAMLETPEVLKTLAGRKWALVGYPVMIGCRDGGDATTDCWVCLALCHCSGVQGWPGLPFCILRSRISLMASSAYLGLT